MAHYRKHIAAAAALNTGIFVAEAAAGYRAGSFALITDSVHNLFDELALVCMYLAFIWSRGHPVGTDHPRPGRNSSSGATGRGARSCSCTYRPMAAQVGRLALRP